MLASILDRFGVVFHLVLDAQMDSGGGGCIVLMGPLGPPGRSRGCLGPLCWLSWVRGLVLGTLKLLLGSFWCAPGAVWVLVGAYLLLGGALFLALAASCFLLSSYTLWEL